jgi:hypothetical protein
MKTILKVLGGAAVALAVMSVSIKEVNADRPDFNRGDRRGYGDGRRDDRRFESRRGEFRRVEPRREHRSFWDFSFLFAYSPPPVYSYAPPPPVYYSSAPAVYSVPSQPGLPMGIADVKAMANSGVSDEIIISQIRSSRVVYHLTTAEIIDLTNCRVSQRVIDFMINTASS